MRSIWLASLFACACVGLAQAAPAGAYRIAATGDEAACARVCAQDALCQGFAYVNGSCALRATVPSPETASAWRPGSRARDWAVQAPIAPPAETAPAPTGPTLRADVAADELLGGPSTDDDLRLRLMP